jgi:probable rRNA maturation factor
MSRPIIEIHVDEAFRHDVRPRTLRRAAELAIMRARVSGPSRATVTVTDDDTLRELNRVHRGEDSVTDVLSFGASARARDGVVEQDDFPVGADEEPGLGDVIISFPQARRQAEAAPHEVERELALLTAHGILHLLGYDHATEAEEKAMFATQAAVLDEVMERRRTVRRAVSGARS